MRGRMVFKMLPMAISALQAYLRPDAILQQYQAALPGETQRLIRFPEMVFPCKRKPSN